jgi:hypothetical protein
MRGGHSDIRQYAILGCLPDPNLSELMAWLLLQLSFRDSSDASLAVRIQSVLHASLSGAFTAAGTCCLSESTVVCIERLAEGPKAIM